MIIDGVGWYFKPENAGTTLVLATVVLWVAVLVGLFGWWLYKNTRSLIVRIQRRGRDRKVRIEQEKRESSIIADLITEALERAAYEGKLPDERRNFWYNRLGNVLNIPDLLPKGRKTLKKRIADRLGKIVGPKKNIPGDPPNQEVKPNKFPAAKKAFALFE